MIDRRLYRLLVLAVWMVSFAGVRADGTRSNTEVGRTENVSDSSLCPVASSGDIAIVDFCPEEDLHRGIGVCRELLAGQFKRFGVVAKTIVIGKNYGTARFASPFLGLIGNVSNVNNLWLNNHRSDIEGRSLPYVLDEETYPELFSFFGFSVVPCRCRVLSRLNNVLVVTQPSSLIQTNRIHSGIRLFLHGDNLFTGRNSTSTGSRRGLSGGSGSNLGSISLFLHYLQGVGELPSVLSERFYSCIQPFTAQLGLFSGVIGIEERQNYKQAGRDSHDPIWPMVLALILGCTINLFGSYLVFFQSLRPRIVNWRVFALGVFLIIVGGISIHHVMPQFD